MPRATKYYTIRYIVQPINGGFGVFKWKEPYDWPGELMELFQREQEADAMALLLTEKLLQDQKVLA